MNTSIRNIVFSGLFISSGLTFAEPPIIVDENNPFLNEKSQKSINEPNGVSIYSFSKEEMSIANKNESKSYLNAIESTNNFGYVEVDSSEIRDFNKLIAEYVQHDSDFKISKMRSLLLKQALSDRATLSAIVPNKISNVNSFKKADLTSIITSEKSLVLESSSGNFIKGKGWDSLTRIVKNPEFGILIIDEWDFSDESSGVIMDRDAINIHINGNPGIIIVKQDEHGNAETSLSWVTDSKSYSILLNKNVYQEGLINSLVLLAEKFPSGNASY
ncbi:MAG: hypothetical protein ACTH7Q_14730 [Pseudoalteromonas sp.]